MKVTFTDGDGFIEILTSASSTAVAAAATPDEEDEETAPEPAPEEEEETPQEPPPKPTGLTAVVTPEGHIKLTWTAPGDDSVTGYRILRRRPSLGETTLEIYVSDTGNTNTTYTDTAITAGTKHVYRVKAINAGRYEPVVQLRQPDALRPGVTARPRGPCVTLRGSPSEP